MTGDNDGEPRERDGRIERALSRGQETGAVRTVAHSFEEGSLPREIRTCVYAGI
jgi:hypothetical protein